jgi:hypothetical protein
MKFRKAATFYVHQGREYTWGERSHGDFPYTYYHFHSTDPSSYPDEVFLGADVRIAYRACVMALVKGEKVFVEEIIENKIRIHIEPGSKAIKLLGAMHVGGWYSGIVPIKMVSEAWEQSMEADNYLGPEGLESKVPVEL